LYLKEIEIKGFKSFANKIKLNITPGITVIVGPNGSGKSNITDAVRWILGEQNIRSLRGNKITDMIFSGNNDQKIRNFAEASILFDNNDRKLPVDSEEVQLKRIVYRSGETENYINNLPCKLRDIHELFQGTGLGRNSYSIIAQGKVDFVLSAKPTERRTLFDEASNISSYNNKKEVAIKKLDLVDNNLFRVSDILAEVKENLYHYKKKADELKLYHSYRDNIKKLEFFFLSQQYLLYHKNIRNSDKNLSYLKNEIVKIDKILTDEKKKIIQIEQEKNHLEQQLNDSENNFQVSEREKNNINSLLIVLKQKKLEIAQRIKNLHEDAERAFKQLQKFRDSISDIDKDIQETNQNTSIMKEEFNQKEALKEKLHNVFTYYKQKEQKIENDRQNFNANYASLYREERIKEETVLESLESSLGEIKKEKENIHSKLQNKKKWLENIATNIGYLENNINHLKKEKNQIEELLTKNMLIIDQKTNFIQNYSNDIILKNKEKDFLEELRKKNQIESVSPNDEELWNKKYSQDIEWIGEVNSLIEHIPDKIEKVIRSILYDRTKLIRVNNSKNIVYINQLMKARNLGQIKIIADNIISKKDLNMKEIGDIANQQKILGFANQLISFPLQYKNVFKILLGHILVVEDMKTVFNLFEKLRGKCMIISLDGMVIDFKGIITLHNISGAKLFHDYHLPVKRIAQLEEEIRSTHTKIEQHQGVLKDRDSKNKILYQKIESINQQIEKYVVKLREEKDHSLEMNKKILEMQSRSEELTNEQKEQDKGREHLKKNIVISQTNIKQIEKYMAIFHLYLQTLSKLKDLCVKDLDRLQKNLENMKMKFNWNKEREILLQKRKKEMNHFIQGYHYEEKERQEKINNYNKEKLQLIDQENTLKEKLRLLLEDRKRWDTERIRHKDILKEKDGLIKSSREKLEENQRKLEDKKNILHRDEMSHVQNQEKMNHLIHTIKNQYNVSVEEILLHKNEANSQKEASEKIAEYKEKIGSMGQINFDALQEYQNQSSRFADLQGKKDEIMQSKEKLINLINEIDRVAEYHFYQTFLKVEVSFKDIFQKLFHGGEVSLELSDNKKLLETGIEVMVQPPGKNLQNISLLSTGEKALTAIALLFALWKANPSPFCFFDEIDSALDEVNALRLAYFLKNEDLKDAQIIIITHQKEVMEAADALYGIIMEGYGVSKLMSVRMLDLGEWQN
jgi:chromosome segregation protein